MIILFIKQKLCKVKRNDRFAFNKIPFTPWRYANELNTEIVIT